MSRVAINGFGRIGRATAKLVLEEEGLELVALNDLVPTENLAYLLKYDTAYGRYERKVEHDGGGLTIGEKNIPVFREKDPANLPWKDLGVDLVFECTGVFDKRDDLAKHVEAGAKWVILSAPTKDENVPTLVHGVNEAPGSAEIVSCASCTTNCITPVLEVLGRRIGVKKAVMTTVHAYTASQSVVDAPAKKTRRGRAAAANFVPTSTGAAVAGTKALPQYEGKFDGVAVRGPVIVGSLADVVFLTERATSVEEVNDVFREEAQTDRYRGILKATDDPVVSSDVIGETAASLVDLGMTQVVDGDLVKIMSWYDNEMGYSMQMIREAKRALA